MNVFLSLPEEFHDPPDKTFFDFHLRKPLLPPEKDLGIPSRSSRPIVDDLETMELRNLASGLEELQDPGFMLGRFFSDCSNLNIPNSRHCAPAIPRRILDAHHTIVLNTFGPAAAREYLIAVDQLSSGLTDTQQMKSYEYSGLMLQSAVTWRNCRNYHNISEMFNLPHWRSTVGTKIWRTDSNHQFLRVSFKAASGTKYQLILGHHAGILKVTADKIYTTISHDLLLMLQDTLLSRWLTLKIINTFKDPHIPRNPKSGNIQEIYAAGDQILASLGNQGFQLIKFLEPLCIGLVQKELDEGLGDAKGGAFLEETVSEFYKSAEQLGCCALAENFYRKLLEVTPRLGLLQVYGCFRHWGHPIIQPLTGLTKLHSRGNKIILPDLNLTRDLADDLAKTLLVAHYQRHQSWPEKAFIPEHVSPLLALCIRENRLPSAREGLLIGKKWRFVSFTSLFDIPTKIPIGMILEDKAHSRTREDLISCLFREVREPVSRRLLVTALEEEELNIRGLLDEINVSGLSSNDLIIGLKAKEREVKVEGRFFALMTLKLRMYFVATEWLISKYILPVFPEITMGDTFISLQKKIFNITKTQTATSQDCMNFIISLDYEKWNAHQRHESTHEVFSVMDKSFGWTRVISRTHEFFEKSIFYYADYKNLIPRDLSESLPICWHGHQGGMEGLRQKGWTTIGILVLRRVTQDHTVQMSMLAQGDNQVFSLLYKIPPCQSRQELTQETQRLRRKTEKILHEVIDLSNRLGLPVKREETWISRSVFLYGKIPVIQGALCSSVVKIISRLYMTTNDEAPTLQNTLSSLLTSCLTLTQQTHSPILGLSIYHWYSWLLLAQGMDCNVILGEPLYTVLNRKATVAYGISLGERWRPTGDNLQTHLALDLLYRDSIIGGLGGSNLYRWVVRQFPDPLTEALSFARTILVESQNPLVSSLGRRLLHVTLEEDRECFDMLLQDPTSIPVKGSSKSINILKNAVVQYLQGATWIKNRVVLESLQLATFHRDQVKEDLQTITPCFPRFLSELWGATVLGRGDFYLGKLSSTTTLVTLSRTRGRMHVRERLKRAEKSMVSLWLGQVLQAQTEDEGHCPTKLAQTLRETGWKKPVVGITLPHPSTQWGIFPALKGDCPQCRASNIYLREFISIYVNPVLLKDPRAISGPGCFTPYLGSITSEEASTNPYGSMSTDEPLLKNAIHLLRAINWIVAPESNLHSSLVNLLKSLTDAFDSGLPASDQERSGSGCHRFHAERVGGGAFPSVGFTSLSHFCFNSNDLTVLGRGEENFAILFQAVVSFYFTLLATKAVCGESLYPTYHLHPICEDCLPPVPDLWLECPHEIQFPSLRDSTEFFLRKELFNIYEAPRVELKPGHFQSDSELTKFLSCGIGILISLFFQSSRRQPDSDASDVLNLSYFRALPPHYFSLSLCGALLIVALNKIIKSGKAWRFQGERLVSHIHREARVYANIPGLFSKLTMIFLIPSYWNYCLNKAYLGGTAFPLTHQDGESTIRNWAFSQLEDESTLHEALCFLATHNIWVFHDLNSLQLVSKYHIASTVSHYIVSGEDIPPSTLDTLQKLDHSHPPKVLYGTKPVKLLTQESQQVKIRSSTLTLKSAVKALPNVASEDLNVLTGKWVSSKIPQHHLIWSSRSCMEEGEAKGPWYSQSIGVHSLRLVCRLTTTPMKLAPILRYLNVSEGLMFSLGDGSGGITAYLLGRYACSTVIFNTLIDHHNEILQSTGTVIPPAVYLLPEPDQARLVNRKDCTSGPSDLIDPSTLTHLSLFSHLSEKATTLIICDAEPLLPDHMYNIYSNIKELVTKVDRNPDLVVVLKLHLSRDVSWKVLDDAVCYWSSIELLRSDFSRYGSSEVYACLREWGGRHTGELPSQGKQWILGQLARNTPTQEYHDLSLIPYEAAWGKGPLSDKSRTRRLMAKITALTNLNKAQPSTVSPLPLEAFNYILTCYWELLSLESGNLTKVSQASLERRVAAIIGMEISLSLCFRCESLFVKHASLNWSEIRVSVTSRRGHSLISRSDRKEIWQLDCSTERHLAADAARATSSWLLVPRHSYSSMSTLVRWWAKESQIFKFLAVLSEPNSASSDTNSLLDQFNFKHFPDLVPH
ncbi:TPA_asm: hypothetical protein [Sphaeridiorhabdovirus 1]|nr:TPA_asm: hypothetical protein [Sphaeridiorhabdovirus 1]